ncbi:MAG: UDP-N-acetylmuramate:L-alanyl-gamma-D-glutamyl-meso-diaminopimelate ligase [Pseudohongiellaceae bacterium]
MHLHILGICGTFMGSLALLARELGHTVSGSDLNVYPPMSTQLEEQGVEVLQGYDAAHLRPAPDLVVIGNALSRGNPAVEHVLDEGLEYCSGPEWLSRHVLPGRWVLAVSGTHGKTTTSAMLAWILEYAGLAPGYLIGGVLQDFPVSARAGSSDFFVVEADEYDSAFFDKRSKFIHYRPDTLIINNLEFDHADIFPDLAAIQRQFHHLIRTVPSRGLIVAPQQDAAVEGVLAQGCWTPVQCFAVDGTVPLEEHPERGGAHWLAEPVNEAADVFLLTVPGTTEDALTVRMRMSGRHNIANAVAAMAAARHVGVAPAVAAEALARFRGVRRRLERLGEVSGVTVYDDFAHHPTAIRETLNTVRAWLGGFSTDQRLIAVIEPRSRTMQMGVHQEALLDACRAADLAVWFQPPGVALDLEALTQQDDVPALVFQETAEIVQYLATSSRPGDHVVIMSNGGFGGIHAALLEALAAGSIE